MLSSSPGVDIKQFGIGLDGSPGVAAEVAVGAQVGPVLPTGIGLAVLGALLAALAGWMINKGSRGRSL